MSADPPPASRSRNMPARRSRGRSLNSSEYVIRSRKYGRYRRNSRMEFAVNRRGTGLFSTKTVQPVLGFAKDEVLDLVEEDDGLRLVRQRLDRVLQAHPTPYRKAGFGTMFPSPDRVERRSHFGGHRPAELGLPAAGRTVGQESNAAPVFSPVPRQKGPPRRVGGNPPRPEPNARTPPREGSPAPEPRVGDGGCASRSSAHGIPQTGKDRPETLTKRVERMARSMMPGGTPIHRPGGTREVPTLPPGDA